MTGEQLHACQKCGRPLAASDRHRNCGPCRRRAALDDARQAGEQAWLRKSLHKQLDPFLADVLQLVHPDKHPPERAALATQVTRALLELKGADV